MSADTDTDTIGASCSYHRIGDDARSSWPYLRRFIIASTAISVSAALIASKLLGGGGVTAATFRVEGANLQESDVVRSVNGWLNYTLRVEGGTWHLPYGQISFRTRLYNGGTPGPVLIASPGDRIRIVIDNRLESDDGMSVLPSQIGWRRANTTNLHLHGIHDDAYHDNTFARVKPGQSMVYQYQLEPRSGSTLLYYHPHADGAISLQAFGGMGGAVVIEDAVQEAALALPAVRTHVLMLMGLDFDPLSNGLPNKDYVTTQLNNGNTSNLSPQLYNPTGFTGRVLLVNGGLPLREDVMAGQWVRLKLVNAVIHSLGALLLGFDGSESEESTCGLVVLALDGVWLTEPRYVPSLLMPQGGRAEVLIGCSTAGVYTFGTLGKHKVLGSIMPDRSAVATLHVAGSKGSTTSMATLPDALPGPPVYYSDLRDAVVEKRDTIAFSTPTGGNVVNLRTYEPSTPMFHLKLGSIVEWYLEGIEDPGSYAKLHPYHQHMSHFQVIKVIADDKSVASLLATEGEWRDTIPLYGRASYVIRFVAPFEGMMTVHCHIQKHAEQGMMAIAKIER